MKVEIKGQNFINLNCFVNVHLIWTQQGTSNIILFLLVSYSLARSIFFTNAITLKAVNATLPYMSQRPWGVAGARHQRSCTVDRNAVRWRIRPVLFYANTTMGVPREKFNIGVIFSANITMCVSQEKFNFGVLFYANPTMGVPQKKFNFGFD